jgi:hypothetical protein
MFEALASTSHVVLIICSYVQDIAANRINEWVFSSVHDTFSLFDNWFRT